MKTYIVTPHIRTDGYNEESQHVSDLEIRKIVAELSSKPCLVGNTALTHCILVDSSTVIYWTSLFVILGVLGCFYSIFDGKILLANNADPDQMPHDVASDLDLHCLPLTLLWVSR